MQIGISPTGFAPEQIVLTPPDFDKIVWSETVNPIFTYENLSVQTQALANTITVYTRASSPADGNPYFFWDEGSFGEVPHSGNLVDLTQPLPPSSGTLMPTITPAATSASITWHTPSETVGQVLYRAVGQELEPGDVGPYAVYLPLAMSMGSSSGWLTTPVGNWMITHWVQLTDLQPGTTYEYVVLSYGYHNGECRTLTSETTVPRTFTTLPSP